jgi:hypothetical protein
MYIHMLVDNNKEIVINVCNYFINYREIYGHLNKL